MILSNNLSNHIVDVSYRYLGKVFNYKEYNCVHFVREVYLNAGIIFPLLSVRDFPPVDFHLSDHEFSNMPIGHTVFFKRKESKSERFWTHVAIIISSDSMIHCTRHLGSGVIITPKSRFMEVYDITPKIQSKY